MPVDGGVTQKTKVVYNSQKPIWAECFVLPEDPSLLARRWVWGRPVALFVCAMKGPACTTLTFWVSALYIPLNPFASVSWQGWDQGCATDTLYPR